MMRERMLAGWSKAARKAMAEQKYRPLATSLMTVEQAAIAAELERKRQLPIHSGQNLTGREFGKLFGTCGGKPVNVSAHLLLNGEKTDCGCTEVERLRIATRRAAQERKKQSLYRRRIRLARKREQNEERRKRVRRARTAAVARRSRTVRKTLH